MEPLNWRAPLTPLLACDLVMVIFFGGLPSSRMSQGDILSVSKTILNDDRCKPTEPRVPLSLLILYPSFIVFIMRDTARPIYFIVVVACAALVALMSRLLPASRIGIPQRFQTRSGLRFGSASLSKITNATTTTRPFQDCTGTASERRSLAAMGDEATQQDWRDMAACTMERRRQLQAHFFLHVSKSGGTSICDFTKQQRQACFSQDLQDAHCQIGDPLHTGPRWMHTTPDNFKVAKWIPFNDNHTPNPTCDEMRQYTQEQGIKFLMKENYLPRKEPAGGGTSCEKSFWTSIILRDPADRVVSHYNHMRRGCLKDNDHALCESEMLSSADNHYFNLTKMKSNFHLITDNYYIRSLSEKAVFHDERDIGNDKVLLQRALTVLRGIDWIMLLEDHDTMPFILHEGLGLEGPLLHSNSNHGEHIDVTAQDVRRLRRWNRADYVLYNEALRLHQLDVVSIKKFQQYAPEALGSARANDKSCCGVIC